MMKNPRRIGVSIAAMAIAASSHAHAQDEANADVQGFGLEEIVVTAQKREESLQDTPISISVMSGDQLEKRGVTGLTDLMDGGIPSLRISPFSGRTSALSVSMRGINAGDATQISRDSAVGIYLDGVYLGRSHALGGELFEIERMEVLKGPQGTLFGRNAVGGAVNIISKRPSGRFELSQTVGVRNLDGWNSVTRLNLPEFAGISIKVDAVIARRGGFTENPLPEALDFAEYDRKGIRGQVLWQPADNFSALYSVDASENNSTPYYLQIASLEPGAPALAPMFELEPEPARVARTGLPLDWSVGKSGGQSLVLDWEVSDTIPAQIDQRLSLAQSISI